MIYSASLFQPENHHGTIIPICRTLPKKLPGRVKQRCLASHPLRKLLMPSKQLLADYKEVEAKYKAEIDRLKKLGYENPGTFLSHLKVCGSFDAAVNTPEPELPPKPEEFYIPRYRAQCRENQAAIKKALGALAEACRESQEDFTLACWEPAGSFCHRNLAMKLVMAWFPSVYGGCD